MPGFDEAFRNVLDRWAEPVYRYHLARRGDWQDAEILTTLSFLDAWLSGQSSPAGLFRLAAAREARGSGHHKSETSPPEPADFTSSSLYQASDEVDRSEQDRLFQRAQITGLGPYWSSLPPGQADAVALVCFGGLDAGLAGEVLHVSPERIHAWLEGQVEVAVHLSALAGQTAIPPEFTAELMEALAQVPRPRGWQRWLARIEQQWSWRFFLLRPVLQRSPGLAPSFAILLLLAFGVWTTLRMTAQPAFVPPVQATVTPTDSAFIQASSPPGSPIPAAGLLVPPSQSTCLDWQNTFESYLSANAALVLSSNFNDPAGTGPDYFGLGCFLTVNTIRLQSLNDQTLTNQILALLEKQGFMPIKQFPVVFYFNSQASGGDPGSAFHGQGFSLNHGDQRAVLELVSRAATHAMPILPDSTVSPDDALAPRQTEQVVYLGLATHAARTALDGFISQWAAGNGQAIQSLSHSLRARLDRLSALDNLVGIRRGADRRVQITWSIKENTGDRLRLEAYADEVSQIALPGRRDGPFQLVLSQEAGQWKVSDLATGIIFSPSDDQMILVDPSGQIYTQSLADGVRVSLSQPGFYNPQAPSKIQAAPPSVSPDGEWLYLTPPGASAGWLISLDGMAHLQMEGVPLEMTWSPDDLQMAYVLSDHPNQVFSNWLGYLRTDRPILLATTPGSISALAWSPKGDQIAYTYTQFDPVPQNPGAGHPPIEPSDAQQPPADPSYARPIYGSLVMASLSLSTHTQQDLTSINWNDQNTIASQGALQWTTGGHELWFTPGMISYHFLDRLTYRLIADPVNQYRAGLPDPPRQSLYVSSQPLALSPDKNWLAVTYFKVNDAWPPKMAVLALQTAGDSPGKNQWTVLLPDIASIDWTREGSNIIVSEVSGRPGDLVRINPNTAEMQGVLKNVTYLGLVSGLQAAGQATPLVANLAHFGLPAYGSAWTSIPAPNLHMTLSIPAGWKTWLPDTAINNWGTSSTNGSGGWQTSPSNSVIAAPDSQLTVANFDFTSPVGFTSLERGDVYLSITRTSLGATLPADWLRAQSRNASLAITNDVDGYPAFFWLSKDEGLFSNTMLFTTEDSGYTINWFSTDPAATGVIQDLLKSIQIMK